MALLAIAADRGADGGGPPRLPDAEIFATNNTAVITDPADPRLSDPLKGFARQVERIIDDGGGEPARLAAARRRVLLLRSGDHDVRALARVRRRPRRRDELHTIADDDPRALRPAVGADVRQAAGRRPDVDAVELEVPGVSAQALRDGLLADAEARERLFGGSVTQDGHLLLVADCADADLARDVREADRRRREAREVTRYGEREFVEGRRGRRGSRSARS